MKYPDNDMDELFNKAGQDYPLRTDQKNWDAVHGAILREQQALATGGKRRRYSRYLPLLLLLLIPGAYFISEHNYKPGDKKIENAVSTENPNENSAPVEKDQPGSSADAAKQRNLASGKNIPVLAKGGTIIPKREVLTTTEVLTTSPSQFSEEVPTERNQSPTAFAVLPVVPVAGWLSPSSSIKINFKPTPEGKNDVAKVSKTRITKNRFFYYGVVAGPDVSTIKYQRVENVGYSAGIILGYQFHPRWAVEMSGLWSNKKYYTDGKFFDKTRANIPSTVEVYYLDGGCSMFELPVALRYNFSRKPGGFFMAAGVNSYFMKSENYSYMADGGTGVYEGHREYKKSGNHFLSNLQVSGGIAKKIFKNTNLRIEPYLQIPLKHVGIGSMPITSAGVHLGLIREIK